MNLPLYQQHTVRYTSTPLTMNLPLYQQHTVRYTATPLTINLPLYQQPTVRYTATNHLFNNYWLFLYPRGLWGKYVKIFSWWRFVFSHGNFLRLLNSFTCQSERSKGIKLQITIGNLISVKMLRYVKLCIFFKNLLHSEFATLRVEWLCLYCALSACNFYLDIVC